MVKIEAMNMIRMRGRNKVEKPAMDVDLSEETITFLTP
jgi:hypothetical protein